MARPHRRALAFLGFWVRRLLTTQRESARWSISLHYRIASLQGWIDVEPAVPCRDRPRAAVWCSRAALAAGRHVRSPGQRGAPRGDQDRLIQINNRGGLSL
jgi:hypothetical protein